MPAFHDARLLNDCCFNRVMMLNYLYLKQLQGVLNFYNGKLM